MRAMERMKRTQAGWKLYRRVILCVTREIAGAQENGSASAVGLYNLTKLVERELDPPMVPANWIWIVNEMCKSSQQDDLMQMQLVVRCSNQGVKQMAARGTALDQVAEHFGASTFFLTGGAVDWCLFFNKIKNMCRSSKEQRCKAIRARDVAVPARWKLSWVHVPHTAYMGSFSRYKGDPNQRPYLLLPSPPSLLLPSPVK